MTFKVGDFDIENAIGHNARTQRVGTDYLYVTGDYTKGEVGAQSFIDSLTTEFRYAGRYAKHAIPGASADTIQDMSPDSSVLRFVSVGTTSGMFVSDWFAVDDYNYHMRAGRPDVVTFWLRMTRIRQ